MFSFPEDGVPKENNIIIISSNLHSSVNSCAPWTQVKLGWF